MEIQKPSLISSLSEYLKKPHYDIKISDAGFLNKLADILKLWSLGIVIAIFAAYLSSIFMESAGLDNSQNLLEDFFDNSPAIAIVLIVFFWGPITEELTFRLFLRFSPYKFGFFLSFLLFLIFEISMNASSFLSETVDQVINRLGLLYSFIGLITSVIILGLFFSLLISKSNKSGKFEKFYKKYFAYLFYASSLTFAFVHFYNYANFQDLWLALPFLIAPQLLLGLILAYIRMFYGFGWAIFFHSFHNGIASLPPLLFSQVSESSFEAIRKTAEGEPLVIPIYEKIFYMLGMASALIIFLLVLIFFFSLLRNHFRYIKQKNAVKNKD